MRCSNARVLVWSEISRELTLHGPMPIIGNSSSSGVPALKSAGDRTRRRFYSLLGTLHAPEIRFYTRRLHLAIYLNLLFASCCGTLPSCHGVSRETTYLHWHLACTVHHYSFVSALSLPLFFSAILPNCSIRFPSLA